MHSTIAQSIKSQANIVSVGTVLAVMLPAVMLPAVVFASGGASAAGSKASNSKAGNTVDQPSWSEDVAGIVHSNCAQCHAPEQSAPMSLRTYAEARPWAKSIARKVESKAMPPWHASGGIAEFANDRSLSDAEIDTIVRWAKAGAPAGDLSKAPEPPPMPTGDWKLGEPDLVVTFDSVDVPGDGPDLFKDLIGKTGLKEDRWITAVEVLPGNAKVVHHVITYKVKGFNFDPTEGWLGAWAAGLDPMVFPEGTGRLLARGSNLIADMHYHPSGEPQTDQTRIGLHFADEPPAKELTNVWILNENFKIAAGESNHEVRAETKFWQSGKILGLLPHMHYRGKDFTYTAKYPDGTEEVLLSVDKYDFNWQTGYYPKEPIAIPEGTVIECVAHFDNSSGNPFNPDPTVDVTFGQESYDEMMIGFVDFVVDEGVAPKTPFQIRSAKIPELAKQYPGAVYKISGRPEAERSKPDAYAPLHLPTTGDGVFYVIFGDNGLVAAKVYDIAWKGKSFDAMLESPYGPLQLKGVVKGNDIDVVLVVPAGDEETRDVPFDGERVG